MSVNGVPLGPCRGCGQDAGQARPEPSALATQRRRREQRRDAWSTTNMAAWANNPAHIALLDPKLLRTHKRHHTNYAEEKTIEPQTFPSNYTACLLDDSPLGYRHDLNIHRSYYIFNMIENVLDHVTFSTSKPF